MPKPKLTTEQILEAEKTKADRQERRKGGLRLAKERDLGHVTLGNGVSMEWGPPLRWEIEVDGKTVGLTFEGSGAPEGMFRLNFKGQSLLFDAEEFRKSLRWV